ncbi:MAG: hypothetical protein KJO85_10615 [Gammaproteobacteria bacterium]|nr:hypothetical protein [Gammaproteobacteria bacterium]
MKANTRIHLMRAMCALLAALGCSTLLGDVITLAQARASGDVTVAPNGDIFLGDFGSPALANGTTVVKVLPDGTTSLFAQGLSRALEGNDVDALGNLIQVGFGSNTVFSIDPAGNATVIANLDGPVGVVVDEGNQIFVTMCRADAIARIDPGGVVTQIAVGGGLDCPNGIDVGHDGAFYVVNNINGGMYRVGRDGVVSFFATIPGGGNGHVVYVNGFYYVAGRLAHRIYQVDTAGNVTPYAGTGVDGNTDGPNLQATISRPNGIGASPDGRYLYVIGGSNFSAPTLPVRRIDLPFDEFEINAGLSGAWGNSGTPGQGLFLDVVPDSQLLWMSWFTYGPAPDGAIARVASPFNEWWVALGPYSGASAEMTLIEATGGVFNDTVDVTEQNVGSFTITFSSCTEAEMNYNFDGGPSGVIALERLSPDELCAVLIE